jgi:hypothetical protein
MATKQEIWRTEYKSVYDYYEDILEYFRFGTEPDGDHIVVCCISRTQFNEQYLIVDWPRHLRWLTPKDVAIVVSQGYMPFGFSYHGPVVCIHTD